MPKSILSDDAYISETGNWNVAEQYTKLKIMKPLYLCDFYEDIALFGTENIVDELNSNVSNDLARIKATRRLIKQVIRVIDNSKFAMKKLNTKKTVLKYKDNLLKLEKLIPNVIKQYPDALRIIDYKLFNEIVEKICEIKSKLNEPLNTNHLIFTDKETFDPHKYKEQIKQDAINRG